MQLRALLLVGVAFASVLISGIHLYLVSRQGQKVISVAVEIPMEQNAGLTNVALNIQSVGNREQSVGDREQSVGDRGQLVGDREQSVGNREQSVGDRGQSVGNREQSVGDRGQSVGNREPSVGDREQSVGDREQSVGDRERHSHVQQQSREKEWAAQRETETQRSSLSSSQGMAIPQMSEDGVRQDTRFSWLDIEEDVLNKNMEEYVALLETGEYEIVEKNIDKEEWEAVTSSPSPTTLRGSERDHKNETEGSELMNLATSQAMTTTGSEVLAKDKDELISERETQERGESKVDPGPHVVSKKEYYAKRATTATHSPPTTPPRHRSHNITHITSSQCSRPPCLQYLTQQEKYIYNKCQKRSVARGSVSMPSCRCRFRSPAGHKRAALVSLPGSGNTWVRGLLEKASGLCTGEALRKMVGVAYL